MAELMANRIIKFRGYATKNKTMVDLKAITPLACDPGLLEHGDGLFIPFRADIILMQYTGLADKTGQEIYEGDIFKTGNDCIGWIEWRNSGWVGFIPKNDMFNETVDSLDWVLDMRVDFIGNIYENPELIKSA